jgi:hypothetical protein
VPDLLKTVQGLLAGKLVIAVVSKGKGWIETSLRSAGTKPVLKRGETAAIYSWSGRSTRKGKSKSRGAA